MSSSRDLRIVPDEERPQPDDPPRQDDLRPDHLPTCRFEALARCGLFEAPTAIEPFKVGEPLPRVMQIPDMCRVFVNKSGHPIDRSTFAKMEKKGLFERFELRPGIGPHLPTKQDPDGGQTRWSGELITRWLCCEDGYSRFATVGGGKRQQRRA